MEYVISDLHGRLDLLKQMISIIKLNDNDRLYILGDMVDRGKHGIEILQYCKDTPNIKPIMGNHEDMMITALTYRESNAEYLWACNGGNNTLRAYKRLSPAHKRQILSFVKSLPLYIEVEINDKKFLLVHAGIDPTCINTPIEEHRAEELLWIRDEFLYSKCYEDKTIIFGHTPTCYLNKDKSFKIWYGEGKIGIDCGAVFEDSGGRLSCLRLNDMKEFYI